MRPRRAIGDRDPSRSSQPRMILARTFQRRENIDFDWYLGKADAAIYNLNAADWRVVRVAPGGDITDEWKL